MKNSNIDSLNQRDPEPTRSEWPRESESRNSGHENHDGHKNHDSHDHDGHEGHAPAQDHSGHENHDGHKNHDSPDHNGHDSHDHSGHGAIYKRKFLVSLLFALPILVFSPMMGKALPFTYTFPGSKYVVAILATVLFFYGGLPFIQGAKEELANRKPAMMTLVTLGISVAYIYSMYAFISNSFFPARGHIMDFFWELASLILIMLLGHWIEMSAISNAGNALQRMVELLPSDALLVGEDGRTTQVPLTSIAVGQTVQVLPGERIPTDGTVLTGKTAVNESMVTGEARDVEKSKGDPLIGGSINGTGTITVKVTGTGESGYLSQVMTLMNAAQQDKSRAESLSDQVAGYLFYFALLAGFIAFVVWMALGSGMEFALERLVTVLVIACPHALGLAVPLVTARSTSIAAQNGLLIQNRQALEAARKVDVVVMDKTGTLTEGNFGVSEFTSFKKEYTHQHVLQLMGALEEGSSHPLGVGVLKKIAELGLESFKGEDITNIPGAGIKGTVEGREYRLVSGAYLDSQSISYHREGFKALARKGNSVSYLVEDNIAIGVLAQGDQIKPESYNTIAQLKSRGIRPIMLTGDNSEAANVVAKELGITQVIAEARPEDKEKLVRQLQEEGKVVLMVGDGVNDAPSLARANIGIAIGAGTDVAIESADIILVKSDPSDIIHFLELAKNTTRKTIQNLWWGGGYNLIAIPLAAGVLAKWGFILSPAVGAVLMSLSTVIVAINAMTLRI